MNPSPQCCSTETHKPQQRREGFLIPGPQMSVIYGLVIAVSSWQHVSTSSAPIQMTVEGPWGWLGAWVSHSPVPNKLGQLPLLLLEHLLPKAALVTSTPSGSALVWMTPHQTHWKPGVS